MNFTNNYIPEFLPDNLKWYERDSLMTYIDKLKYDNFIKDTDRHFEKRKSLIFYILHKQARTEKIEVNLLKNIRP